MGDEVSSRCEDDGVEQDVFDLTNGLQRLDNVIAGLGRNAGRSCREDECIWFEIVNQQTCLLGTQVVGLVIDDDQRAA